MSNEYRNPGSPLAEAGVRFFDAPGYPTEFANIANLSNAVKVPGGVSVIHITGQLGITDHGEIVQDPAQQLRQAFLNVEKNLIAAGATQGWRAVYKCVAYHSDLSEERMEIYASLIREFCGLNRPSQTSISVANLWKGAFIEVTVEAIAS